MIINADEVKNIYVNELKKVSNQLQLHIAVLNLINSLKDDTTYIEDVQIVLDYFADLLMGLDDEIISILEF